MMQMETLPFKNDGIIVLGNWSYGYTWFEALR
jgi:hypothetical protein